MCRGGLFIRGSDLFIKIEEGLILAGAVHTGGEHPVGGVVFLIAFGDDVGEVEPVERPVGDGGERTYRIVKSEQSGSYALDILRKYKIAPEQLVAREASDEI